MEFKTDLTDVVLTFTLCQPEKLNPFSVEGFMEFGRAISEASENDEVEAIVITGEGRGFSVGVDLASLLGFLKPDGGKDMDQQRLAAMFDEGVNAMAKAINTSKKPTVAALNGIVAGGGIGIALGCDVIVASEKAAFNMPFVTGLGILPDCGSSWLFARAVGRGRALPAILLGETVSAQEAQSWGLIWKVVAPDALQETARGIAARLAAGPVQMYPALRHAVDAASAQGLQDQLAYEREINIELVQTDAFAEGVSAFGEKRKPNFRATRG